MNNIVTKRLGAGHYAAFINNEYGTWGGFSIESPEQGYWTVYNQHGAIVAESYAKNIVIDFMSRWPVSVINERYDQTA